MRKGGGEISYCAPVSCCVMVFFRRGRVCGCVGGWVIRCPGDCGECGHVTSMGNGGVVNDFGGMLVFVGWVGRWLDLY